MCAHFVQCLVEVEEENYKALAIKLSFIDNLLKQEWGDKSDQLNAGFNFICSSNKKLGYI